MIVRRLSVRDCIQRGRLLDGGWRRLFGGAGPVGKLLAGPSAYCAALLLMSQTATTPSVVRSDGALFIGERVIDVRRCVFNFPLVVRFYFLFIFIFLSILL